MQALIPMLLTTRPSRKVLHGDKQIRPKSPADEHILDLDHVLHQNHLADSEIEPVLY
jgi:hypothetical protein